MYFAHLSPFVLEGATRTLFLGESLVSSRAGSYGLIAGNSWCVPDLFRRTEEQTIAEPV